MTASLEDAEAEILDLLAEPDPDPAAIVDVIRRIEASGDVANPDVAAALGYFWYLVPGDHARRVTEGERWLEDALRRQPNHALARLYLGHFAFDRGISVVPSSICARYQRAPTRSAGRSGAR